MKKKKNARARRTNFNYLDVRRFDDDESYFMSFQFRLFDRRQQRCFFDASNRSDVKLHTSRVCQARQTQCNRCYFYRKHCTLSASNKRHTDTRQFSFFFTLNTAQRQCCCCCYHWWLPMMAGRLAGCRLLDTTVVHVSRVHQVQRCEFGGKNRMFPSMFSKNTKFAVRNARCLANSSIKMSWKLWCAFCTVYCYEWINFYARKMKFSWIKFSNELKRATRCGNVWVTHKVCVLQCHLIWSRWRHRNAANRTNAQLQKMYEKNPMLACVRLHHTIYRLQSANGIWLDYFPPFRFQSILKWLHGVRCANVIARGIYSVRINRTVWMVFRSRLRK